MQFKQNCSQLPAAHAVNPGAQHAECVWWCDDDQSFGIATKLTEAGSMEITAAAGGAVTVYPQQGLTIVECADGEQQGKGGSGTAIALALGIHLMQAGADKAAIKAGIDSSCAKGDRRIGETYAITLICANTPALRARHTAGDRMESGSTNHFVPTMFYMKH